MITNLAEYRASLSPEKQSQKALEVAQRALIELERRIKIAREEIEERENDDVS